jgi:hypothetical protein
MEFFPNLKNHEKLKMRSCTFPGKNQGRQIRKGKILE